MTQVSCTITIHAPADAIWQVIGDFGAASQYLVGVVNCTVEGERVGALRTLTSADGSIVIERLEALNEATHRLSYALLTDTPFRNCLTTMTVRDLGPSLAELEWSATFEPDAQFRWQASHERVTNNLRHSFCRHAWVAALFADDLTSRSVNTDSTT